VEHDIALYDIALLITNDLSKYEGHVGATPPCIAPQKKYQIVASEGKQVTEYTERKASEEVNLADLNAQAL
jgi:hypothetical protein